MSVHFSRKRFYFISYQLKKKKTLLVEVLLLLSLMSSMLMMLAGPQPHQRPAFEAFEASLVLCRRSGRAAMQPPLIHERYGSCVGVPVPP